MSNIGISVNERLLRLLREALETKVIEVWNLPDGRILDHAPDHSYDFYDSCRRWIPVGVFRWYQAMQLLNADPETRDSARAIWDGFVSTGLATKHILPDGRVEHVLRIPTYPAPKKPKKKKQSEPQWGKPELSDGIDPLDPSAQTRD